MPHASHYIYGEWIKGNGIEFPSINPATGEPLWQGAMATEEEVGNAVTAAKTSFHTWSRTTLDERINQIHWFSDLLQNEREPLTDIIALETGKPYWEVKTEIDLMVMKIALSIDAHFERCSEKRINTPDAVNALRFKPHGPIAVIGPFNLPAHIPFTHIVPALIAGNTIVFKPSERTPMTGEWLTKLIVQAGFPPGVFNLIQGDGETGRALVNHDDLAGLFFTGSYRTGCDIHRSCAGKPEKVLAMEMGGNNPLVVHECSEIDAAVYLTILSAFITSGQRCVCARRLIVPQSNQGDQFLERLIQVVSNLACGQNTEKPEPFMGPLINKESANRVWDSYQRILSNGAEVLVAMKRNEQFPALLTPAIVEITNPMQAADEEIFGPLLQVIRTPDFETAIDEANRTKYGLVAGLVSDSQDLFQRFWRDARAGVINWNRQTTGVSPHLPFGGVGLSGNHRPSGSFAADYSSYPVSSLERTTLMQPANLVPGVFM